MSKENISDVLSAAFAGMNSNQLEEKLMVPAREGLTHQVRDYFYYKRSEVDKKHIAFAILKSPEDFPAKAEIISILFDARFDTKDFFESAYITMPDVERDLWSLYAKVPSEDTARAAAMLLTEYMRYRSINDEESYAPDFDNLIRPDGDRTEPALIEQLKESVLATQNALVDYVVLEGPSMILNRAAALLNVMSDDKGAEIWMKKLADVKITISDSIRAGEIRSMQPVFQ